MKKKIKFWKFWERPIYEIREYSFNLFENIVRFQLLQIKIQPACKVIRLKKNNFYVSKLVTDWKTWLKCGFLNFFFWPADVSNLSRSQLCSVWNMELDFWMNKIQDRTQSWKSLLFKVYYCVCHFFWSIFWQASSQKNWKKISKQKKKKIKSLNFVE